MRKEFNDKAIAHCSLKSIKNHYRYFFALPKKRDYKPHIEWNNRAPILCFNETNELVFKGEILEAACPVEEMLKEHWYVKRVGLNAFYELVVWRLRFVVRFSTKSG